MRLKLDENLPQRLASTLKTLGHDVHTVHEQGLTGSSDSQVWDAVQSENRFLITHTRDSPLLQQHLNCRIGR
jgi:predicted nuclease of predicted toxin-antitoxin system